MQGEIITSAEMKQANDLARTVDRVIASNSRNAALCAQLTPVRDFLDRLAWKGAER